MTDRPQGHLQTLYEISRTINSSLDLNEVLELIMDQVITVTGAGRGFLMLADDSGRLAFRVARGIDRTAIENPTPEISQGVIESVAKTGQPLLTSNAQDDERLASRMSTVMKSLRSVLCVPLRLKDRTIGLVYVDNKLREGIFDQASLELLTAFAGQAATALENARLYGVAVEKGRMERELSMAREIQRGLLPESPPNVPGYELAAHWRSAREVAGDFYDFIPLSSGGLGVLIADVSDKGAPAALFMAVARSIIRASAVNVASPAEAMGRANRLVAADAKGGMFVTAYYAVLDADGVTTTSAGHNPPLIYRRQTGKVERAPAGGIPLGILETAAFETHALSMAPGDVLLLYTDGITEAFDSQGREFGEARLRQVLESAANGSAGDIARAIRAAIDDHLGSAPPSDDLTLVVVAATGTNSHLRPPTAVV